MSQQRVAAGLTVVVVALTPVFVLTQETRSPLAPRTAWGQPDLQGIWDFRSITPLQRPEELADQPFLTAEEAVNLEQEVVDRNTRLWNRPAQRTVAGESVDRGTEGAPGAYNNFWMDRGTRAIGTRRTSLIVDPPNGRLPPLTPEAEARAASRRAYRVEHPADSWLDRSLADRCMFTTGLPIVPSAYNNNVHLFQTPDHVALLIEMTHTVRIIPLDGQSSSRLPQYVGNARGYWEGDTLVVETTGFNDVTSLRGSTPSATLVERFTRLDGDTLDYEFTIEDPKTWTAPWTANVQLTRTDEPLYEYACHEGNYGMTGILAGARAEENAAVR